VAIGDHTLVALTLHQPGVLNRISGMFRRRGFNISSLSVGQSESEDLARMTFVVKGDDATVEQVTKQLYKLVDVVRVTEIDEDNSIVREMALIKVAASNQNRSEIIQLSEIFRSKIVDVAGESIVIEITGDQSKIDRFIVLLQTFGIKEIMRTGAVAMSRGSSITAQIDSNVASAARINSRPKDYEQNL
jgi:acetolactate synthase-1/3 small subunit